MTMPAGLGGPSGGVGTPMMKISPVRNPRRPTAAFLPDPQAARSAIAHALSGSATSRRNGRPRSVLDMVETAQEDRFADGGRDAIVASGWPCSRSRSGRATSI